MWYEIIPGLAIMTVCLMVPGIATTQIQKFIHGGKERRVARTPWQWYMLQRDVRLTGTGKEPVTKGLENIN